MHRSIFHAVLLFFAAAILPASGQAIAAQPVAACEYASGNLLADTAFTTLEARWNQRKWQYSQHTTNTSFSYAAMEGTLSFEKTGSEPWGLLSQYMDIEGLQGKRVEFSTEVKLDLVEPEIAHGFGYGGGLSILAKQGNRTVVNSSLEHEPRLGTHDWQRISVVFDLPTGTTSLRVGFLHQAGGKMQVRNPALRVVAGGCEPTGKTGSGTS